MKIARTSEANPASAEPSPPALSVVNKVLRWSYYLMFWFVPWSLLTLGQRRCLRRSHVVFFGAATVTFVAHHDLLGATVMFVAMFLSAASLKIVDRDLEGGARVPRTRANLPTDPEL